MGILAVTYRLVYSVTVNVHLLSNPSSNTYECASACFRDENCGVFSWNPQKVRNQAFPYLLVFSLHILLEIFFTYLKTSSMSTSSHPESSLPTDRTRRRPWSRRRNCCGRNRLQSHAVQGQEIIGT